MENAIAITYFIYINQNVQQRSNKRDITPDIHSHLYDYLLVEDLM